MNFRRANHATAQIHWVPVVFSRSQRTEKLRFASALGSISAALSYVSGVEQRLVIEPTSAADTGNRARKTSGTQGTAQKFKVKIFENFFIPFHFAFVNGSFQNANLNFLSNSKRLIFTFALGFVSRSVPFSFAGDVRFLRNVKVLPS